MAKLILSMDGLVLKEIPLVKDRTTIGRKPHNDIQIDNLAISGDHAVIDTIINDAFLEDLHSTNGTFVNGQPVKRYFLQDGDVIELGKYRLKYLSEAEQQAGPQEYEKTMLLRPDMMRRTVEQAASRGFGQMSSAAAIRSTLPPGGVSRGLTFSGPRALGAAVQPARAMIRVVSGSSAGKALELTKDITTIGKPGVQVAVITRRQGGYFITHVDGTTPPRLGGQELELNRPSELHDRDVIEFGGGTRMEFFFES